MISLQGLFSRCANLNPKGVATLSFTRQRTWADCLDRVSRFAGGLNALDLDEGDRVAILGLNSDNYFETFFSIPWAGLSMVPLNIRWAVPENIYALNDCGAKVLIFDDAFMPQVEAFKDQIEGLHTFIYFGDKEVPEWALSYEDMIKENDPAPHSKRFGADTVGIFYTGGTTGFPKGVEHSHNAIWASAIGSSSAIHLPREAIYLHSAPMFHMADFAGTIGCVLSGATHAFIPMFEPGLVFKAIKAFNVTNAVVVPAMIKMMLQHPDLDEADMSSMRTLSYGASPMPAELLTVIMDKWPHMGLSQGYGQTEMAPLISTLTEADHKKGGEILKSAGRPALVSEVKIVDNDDNECLRGISGEIIVRGPQAMKAYWNKPEETAKALRNGWVYTGDAGYLDENGYLFIVDRVKDMVVSGGENVFTGEVENILISHPDVVDVAVIGIPDEEWGEAVHGIVILAAGSDVSESELIEHCRGQIADYKCPKAITVRSDPFPLSGAGKVLKTELRAPFWVGRDRKVN